MLSLFLEFYSEYEIFANLFSNTIFWFFSSANFLYISLLAFWNQVSFCLISWHFVWFRHFSKVISEERDKDKNVAPKEDEGMAHIQLPDITKWVPVVMTISFIVAMAAAWSRRCLPPWSPWRRIRTSRRLTKTWTRRLAPVTRLRPGASPSIRRSAWQRNILHFFICICFKSPDVEKTQC